MKKLFLTAVIIFSFITISNAQSAQFGVTGGFANVSGNVSGGGVTVSDDGSGFFIGILADFGISKFHVQPEILYVNAEETNFLYIPVLLKYYVAPKFNLQAGPQANILLEDTTDVFNSFGLDFSFGAGFDFTKRFFAEARYSFELTNRISDLPGAPSDASVRFNTITVGVGYKFN